MTVYPFDIDSDATIIRVDDNITEIGGEAINQCRDAIIAIEQEMGISPAGSAGSLADRLNVSLEADGSIKASALTSVGLATLPIVNAHVGASAGIAEYKLSLDYSTDDLHTLIVSNTTLINALTGYFNTLNSDLSIHITGGSLLSDNSPARHVASHIDLNAVPSDSRDSGFTWSGLLDKDGDLRLAETVAEALNLINIDLVNHENATSEAHAASAITVDSSDFQELPPTITNVQEALDAIDDLEVSNIGGHRATQHAPGIPRIARSQAFGLPDGYRENVVPVTPATSYLVHSPNVSPVDSISVGDDLISFNPTDTTLFDSQFRLVKVGDVVRINYGNAVEASYMVESVRYTPGSEWIVRINGVNLYDSSTCLARIDRSKYDENTYGVLAVAPANASPIGDFSTIMSSLIVGSPRGASVLGLGFDPNQLDATHYKLYLELYPSGDPTEKIISLPAIDVTGNAGATPGLYTLESVVRETNNSLRQTGYNYRFIAFEYRGEFGLMLADAIGSASFSVVNGSNSSGTIVTGIYTENVVDASDPENFDPLGLGVLGADIASPTYQTAFVDSTSAQYPTKVIVPLKERNYIVNGRRRDDFAATYLANEDGYWDGYISDRTVVGIATVETTYTVLEDLRAAGLKTGKTLVIQPAVEFDDSTYDDVDYGRFIIKDVNFVATCEGSYHTEITVINGIHAAGTPVAFSSDFPQPVRIFFSEDSISFNIENIIDEVPTGTSWRRFHEVFVSERGNTFTHERARLPVQISSGRSALGTSQFHITDVSPKLRGYRNSDVLDFTKNIRFYVLSYDSDTGEYDGYLGEPLGSGITNTGIRLTARKNVPTRFYDETNVDYVELVFLETEDPGTDVLSSTTPRYADIELFNSLQPNDELLYIASCEVSWPISSSSDQIVRFVKDRREFGSIDANDFTQSAIDFIRAGDRHLHENGVIQGFEYQTINVDDNREIFFSGGIALVNGSIVLANNGSVTIPQISPEGESLPQDVTWAICLNEFGEFTPILVTDEKTQYFATPGSGNYYLQSVSYNELLNVRKDLTLLYLVEATIASVTITEDDLTDLRKNIKGGANNTAITLAGEQVIGNFNDFVVATNWVKNFSTTVKTVKVKGEFTLTEAVDLTGFTSPVVFEGEGGIINITSAKGLLVGSNVELRELTFNYNPTGLSYGSNNKVNSGNGCLYIEPTATIGDSTGEENIKVIDCVFNCSLETTQRPPFIGFDLDKDDIIRNVVIKGNKFNDDATEDQAAVAIITATSGSGTTATGLLNILISENIGLQKQGCYIAPTSWTSGQGINCRNVIISNNSFGAIGFLTSDRGLADDSLDGLQRVSGILVEGNKAIFIGTLDDEGHSVLFSDVFNFGTGRVIISKNFANFIHCNVSSNSTMTPNLSITNNQLDGYSQDYLNDRFETTNFAAIKVAGAANTIVSNINIVENNITYGEYNGEVYEYHIGIMTVFSNPFISKNYVFGIEDSATAGTNTAPIYIYGNNTSSPVRILDNYLSRSSGTSINGFIYDAGPTFPAGNSGFIKNNYFNSRFIDSANTDTTVTNITGIAISDNYNQTYITYVPGTEGKYEFNEVASGHTLSDGYTSAKVNVTPVISTENSIVLTISSGSTSTFSWLVSLNGLIPVGASIVSLSLTAEASGTITNSTFSMELGNENVSAATFETTSDSTAFDFSSAATETTTTLTPSDPDDYRNVQDGTSNLYFILNCDNLVTTPSRSIDFSGLTITYRF